MSERSAVDIICSENYTTVGCDRCPLNSPCIIHAPVGVLSIAMIQAHRDRKLEAANKIMAARK